MYKTILVTVDLADLDTARPAIERATALAQASGGTVRLVHVRQLPAIAFMEFIPPSFDADQQELSEARLAEVAATVRLPAERVSAVVRLGSIYAEVLDEAKKTGADLVVVGSHRPGMATYLLGSNAATIARHAPMSVLVVR